MLGIAAGRLAQLLDSAGGVEDIIGDLERKADVLAVCGQGAASWRGVRLRRQPPSVQAARIRAPVFPR